MLVQFIYALIIAALAALASPAPSSAAESPCPSVLDHNSRSRSVPDLRSLQSHAPFAHLDTFMFSEFLKRGNHCPPKYD